MSVDETAERIVFSALKTFLKQGVKRSSLTEIAFEAGVTRITVYRYFGEKQGLVEAVCRHVACIFRRAGEGSPADSMAQINARLKRLGEELAELPPGNLLAHFDEIRRMYPVAYEEFRAARESSLDRVFEQAVAAAEREHTIREGVNLQVVKAMFWTSVVGLIENPKLIAAGVPLAEICETVTAVLQHGILKNGDTLELAGTVAARGVEYGNS
jgi:AcrR family transcriptional regulator